MEESENGDEWDGVLRVTHLFRGSDEGPPGGRSGRGRNLEEILDGVALSLLSAGHIFRCTVCSTLHPDTPAFGRPELAPGVKSAGVPPGLSNCPLRGGFRPTICNFFCVGGHFTKRSRNVRK
jgi:hypothetical protein